MAKNELVETLKGLLREVLEARFRGGSYAKLARAHGYADGYMRALMDAGIVESSEMLRLVGSVRQDFVDGSRAPASPLGGEAAEHAAVAI